MKATHFAAALFAASMLLTACNQHPVTLPTDDFIAGGTIPIPVDAGDRLDLLWVIDNSKSMCQEQAMIRNNFAEFIDQLDETVVDFHIGVTTTHMREQHTYEPVAIPGRLQSTPQPLPADDRDCWLALDANGEAPSDEEDEDFSPIRAQLEAAVQCMRTPDRSLLDVSDETLRAAMNGQAEVAPLFPDESAYRTIPKVLRSSNYRNDDGTLQLDELRADFACMSMVGARGYAIEKGLGAAVLAVSPEMTGGTPGAPVDPSAPNHGFIRSDARFATIFVTDENDCTHDGSLSEAHLLGSDMCEVWNRPDIEDSPLVDPATLRDQMLQNLMDTKAIDMLGTSDVLVASIHGRSDFYDGPMKPTPDCMVDSPSDAPDCKAFDIEQSDWTKLAPTCRSRLGQAYSGDRYERFLRSFGEGNFYPPADEGARMTGWMCEDSFRPALDAIAQFMRSAPQGCITHPIQECEPGANACPSHATGEPGECVPRGEDGTYICDSFIQVRVNPTAHQPEQLQRAGYCDEVDTFGSCVLAPSAYALESCEGNAHGVRVAWTDPASARQALSGNQLELEWVEAGAP